MPPARAPIRILLVDDHAIVRAGLRMLLESQPGLCVVAEATTNRDAVVAARRERPDIVLLDLDLGGESGLDIMPELAAAAPQSRVVLLTGSRNSEDHLKAVQQGALGVVLKEQAAAVLVEAIEKVNAGGSWLDPALTARLVAGMAGIRAPVARPEAPKTALLTERERDVIGLICEGLQNKAIGQRLFISETTVRHHLTSIFGKLGVENRLELVIYAYRHGLATPPRRA